MVKKYFSFPQSGLISDYHENLYSFLCLGKGEDPANILLLATADMNSLWNQIVNIIDMGLKATEGWTNSREIL